MKEAIADFKKTKSLQIHIITLSDRASRGLYEDKSGPIIKELCENFFNEKKWRIKIRQQIIPDEAEQLNQILSKAKADLTDIIFTTGGTGVGPRDITPEVVRPMLDKEIPGIMEMIRMKFGVIKSNAILSRGIAGVMGQSLIYTLPGSPNAIKDYMLEIFKTIEHVVYMINDMDIH